MKFKKINKYIHKYEFDPSVHNYLYENIDRILDIKKQGNPNFKDWFVKDDTIRDLLDREFKKLAEQYYNLGPIIEYTPALNMYIQDNTQTDYNWHNHSHLVASICAVTYLNIPKEGGRIKFLMEPEEGGYVEITPRVNEVFFFPHWLYHKPTPQKDITPRVSFNWQHSSVKRATHKLTGDLW